ncbi:polyphosphate kinase 1 [soil metagenome]
MEPSPPPTSQPQPQLTPNAPAVATPRDAQNGSGSVEPDLRSPNFYLNRELSWLEFNARLLAEGENELVPLLERLKFLAIVASNLDEFFMVRVAGLKQQLTGEVSELGPDGMTPAEVVALIAERVHLLVEAQAKCLDNILPALAQNGVLLVKPDQLDEAERRTLDARFEAEIFPILTPIAIDPGHPFPHLRNKALNLGVMFDRDGGSESAFGVVQVPVMLPRLLEVSGIKTPGGQPARHAFVLIEDLIARHVSTIFPGVRLRGVYGFRVTRNFDLEIDEEEAQDLLQTIQAELRRRERGNAVRLEVTGNATPSSLAKLVKALKLDADRDVYVTRGMLNLADVMQLVSSRDEKRELKDEPFAPLQVPPLRDADDPFAVIREQDVMIHQPYESFEHVVDFIARAADDPDVLAIKQTLYRAGGDSPIVKALARAAESGKQVTAIVELKARFDEESNIQWARTLEQSGVNVVYGLLGLKTHAKCSLVIRREKGKLKRYVHLSTGNYNPTTARFYTDISLLTCRESIGEDASSLFNLLTGYSAPPKWKTLIVAPLGLHEAVLGLIAREADHARNGRPARIVAKMNALVDEDVIEALYRASQAGVSITLLVRGICCLRPGVPGVSDNIEVHALVDRFLEHGRVFSFTNGGKSEIFIASADWMPRNFHRRVELMVPIEDPNLKARLTNILEIEAQDCVKAWRLAGDGHYERATNHGSPINLRAQQRFMELAREKVKVFEASQRISGRFQLARQQIPKPERRPRPPKK